ncbi:response regulator [Anoxynatronum buryatiense]|uniref:Stage 0 sporulation protein A homolog n=1 Tax=Anoxynatronum buryatiense TaxID=489973 RepID=A0AA45WTC2_9CLOT|nr:response regulator transcription factor [Anoxynatronum buryatiense]SMP41489.1 two component transcriptional regulator, LuxR family [Anoxynatronum buryatiense]
MKKDISQIMLVDDHNIVRMGLKGLIDNDPELKVCAEAASLSEAYQLLSSITPDLILLDMKLPDGYGAEGVREMKRMLPGTKVLILTAFAEDYMVQESLRNGADGYLLKNVDGRSIIQAIHNVLNSLMVMDPSVGNTMLSTSRDPLIGQLIDREQMVLNLISQGKTNKEIGESLFLAEKTVRNLITKIMKKINVTNRTEAAAFWLKHRAGKDEDR